MLSGRILCPCLRDLVGHAGQVANGVVNVLETGGGGNFVGLSHGHEDGSLSPRLYKSPQPRLLDPCLDLAGQGRKNRVRTEFPFSGR